MTDLDRVLDSYSLLLHKTDARTAKRFDRMRKVDPESAVAEAITFLTLESAGAHPQIHDKVRSGGPDFLCSGSRFSKRRKGDFFAEATSISRTAISRQSGLRDEVLSGIQGGAYGLVTKNICLKAVSKNRKLKDCEIPTVLSIVSSHISAALLFDAHAAETALTSAPYFRHQIGSSASDPNWYINLKDSVFMKPGPDRSIVACRENISAILLISVYGDKSEVFGILHPQPKHKLNLDLIPNLPFVRVAKWPIEDGKMWTEWVIGRPRGLSIPHSRLSPSA